REYWHTSTSSDRGRNKKSTDHLFHLIPQKSVSHDSGSLRIGCLYYLCAPGGCILLLFPTLRWNASKKFLKCMQCVEVVAWCSWSSVLISSPALSCPNFHDSMLDVSFCKKHHVITLFTYRETRRRTSRARESINPNQEVQVHKEELKPVATDQESWIVDHVGQAERIQIHETGNSLRILQIRFIAFFITSNHILSVE
ncbi:hypothetical protein C0J52_05039, partial [Blattella germanica]